MLGLFFVPARAGFPGKYSDDKGVRVPEPLATGRAGSGKVVGRYRWRKG